MKYIYFALLAMVGLFFIGTAMQKSPQIALQQVDYDFVQKHLPEITDLSTNSFMQNHAITAYYYQETPDRLKPEYISLFHDYVKDTCNQLMAHGGFFFAAVDTKTNKIVGLSIGYPYNASAISPEFITKVFASEALFKEVMGGWWKMMEKYQPSAHDTLSNVYHQSMLAIDPAYTGKGIGSALTQFVTQAIQQRGYKALVVETTSPGAHKIFTDKTGNSSKIITIDQHEHAPTGMHLALRLQIFDKQQADSIIQWFESKRG